MNKEILFITEQLKEIYEGDPWFGRNAKQLLGEVDEQIAFEKPNGQHSILDLLWHIITWKEFVISRLRNDDNKSLSYFETYDWRELDHGNITLWKQGLQQLHEVHAELVTTMQQQHDEILSQKVGGRNYDFRKLLYGIADHDIYHLGQIAYLTKLLKK